MNVGDQNSMGLNYRRRVIYQALNEIFAEPQEIRRYFDLWQREHSKDVHFVVTRFAATVAKAAGLDDARKSLLQRRLFHALTQSYESLPRVPDAWLSPLQSLSTETQGLATPAVVADSASEAPSEPISGARFESAERVVFRAFARVLTGAILTKADRHPGVLQQAVEDLGRRVSGREEELHMQLKRWSLQRFKEDALPALRSPEDFRHIAHQLYLLAADLIGPVQADRLLAQATAEAGRLPEASMFSPQRLL